MATKAEAGTPRLVIVGAVVLSAASIAASVIWWSQRRKGNPIQIRTLATQQELEEQNIVDDENSLYIFPPDRNSIMELNEDEKENEKFTKHIEQMFPSRFDGTTWICVHCNASISPHGKYYRCADCDEFVVCEKCFNKAGVQIHEEQMPKTCTPHVDEFFYSNMCFPHEMKKRLYHTFSCAAVVKKCFEFYPQRKLIGEKQNFPVPISSFKHGHGVPVGSYLWYSFKDIQMFIEYLAKALVSLTGQKFDIIGICSENRLEWAITDLCCITKGFTSAAIPKTVSKVDFVHILRESDLKYIVCSAHTLPVIIEVLSKTENPTIEFVICMDNVRELPSSSIPVYQFDFLIHMGKSLYENEGPVPNISSFGDESVAITYTSGSTGCPKAVLFKEREWLSQFSHFLAFRTCLLYGFLPMDHVSGRVDLYSAVVNGGRLALPSATEGLSKFFEDVKELRPTVFGLIPLICNSIFDQFQNEMQEERKRNPEASEEQCEVVVLAKFRFIFGDRLSSTKVTSAPVTIEMIRFLRRMLQVRVSDGYGSTEAGSISRNERVTQTVRLISVPELSYLITDDPPRGEVFVKRLRMDSYANPEASIGKFKDGWFATGDIAMCTGPHSIRVIDRRSNIIKLSNGDFIAVEPLEREFLTSKFVSAIYIYASSSRSRIVAIVVPNSQLTIDENVILKDLQEIAKKAGFCSYQVPAAIHVETELNSWSEIDGLYTGAGKLCRRKLKEYYYKVIENLYCQIALASVLRGPVDHSRSFQQLGGTSVDAVRLIQQLRVQMVDISFEELMGTNSISDLCLADTTATIRPSVDEQSRISIDNELEQVDLLFASVKNEQAADAVVVDRKVSPVCYFITGATGFLGSQLLQALSTKYETCRFYCLCRDPEKLWKSENVVPLQGDLSKVRFGLTDDIFNTLCDEVDCIVHCGFVVNHLVSYIDMYNTNVKSLLDIIRLSIFGKKQQKPIHFTSSISALTRSPRNESGYAASKWAADHILKQARVRYNLPVFIYRPCLIAGNRITGQINRKDWLHRLLQAVVDFNVVPPVTRKEPLNIVAGDYCVDVIISLMKQKPENEFQFNITQENIGWMDIFDLLVDICPGMKVCASHDEWFQCISRQMKETEHPLLPFLSSFEHGIVDSFHAYDNKSTLTHTQHIPLVPLTRSDLEKTVRELNKK